MLSIRPSDEGFSETKSASDLVFKKKTSFTLFRHKRDTRIAKYAQTASALKPDVLEHLFPVDELPRQNKIARCLSTNEILIYKEARAAIFPLENLPEKITEQRWNLSKTKGLRFTLLPDGKFNVGPEGLPNSKIPAHRQMMNDLPGVSGGGIFVFNNNNAICEITNGSGGLQPDDDSLQLVMMALLYYLENNFIQLAPEVRLGFYNRQTNRFDKYTFTAAEFIARAQALVATYTEQTQLTHLTFQISLLNFIATQPSSENANLSVPACFAMLNDLISSYVDFQQVPLLLEDANAIQLGEEDAEVTVDEVNEVKRVIHQYKERKRSAWNQQNAIATAASTIMSDHKVEATVTSSQLVKPFQPTLPSFAQLRAANFSSPSISDFFNNRKPIPSYSTNVSTPTRSLQTKRDSVGTAIPFFKAQSSAPVSSLNHAVTPTTPDKKRKLNHSAVELPSENTRLAFDFESKEDIGNTMRHLF